MPKLGIDDKNVFKNTIAWVLSGIICLEDHGHSSEQIEKILKFYICTVQTYVNLNIHDSEVSNY